MPTPTTPALLDAELVLALAGRLRRVAARMGVAHAGHPEAARRWQQELVRVGALGSVDPAAAHDAARVLEAEMDDTLAPVAGVDGTTPPERRAGG